MHLFPSPAWIYWDPPREVFTIPFLQHTVVWYGVFFVFGFIAGYFLVLSFLRDALDEIGDSNPKLSSFFLTDRLCWFVVLGTIIGARLGEVFFYDWDYYRNHLTQIVQIWRGGLASHGGGVGIMLALWLYHRKYQRNYPFLSFTYLLDLIVVPTGFAAFFIRLGNFFNQEIIGTVTEMPWGVIFLNAADGTAPQPRHPVQLYEGFAYLATFVLLLALRRTAQRRFNPGFLTGLFFVIVFSSRFFLEFYKATLTNWITAEGGIQMGQYLSIPYVLGGLALMGYAVFAPKKAAATTKIS